MNLFIETPQQQAERLVREQRRLATAQTGSAPWAAPGTAAAGPEAPVDHVSQRDGARPARARGEAYSVQQESYREELAFEKRRAKRRRIGQVLRVIAFAIVTPIALAVIFVASYVLTCIMNGATPDEVAELLRGLFARVQGFAMDALASW